MKLRYLAFILLGFMACDNELNVIEDYQDIPIVYGVLSSSDTAQYIRLERAFVDPNTSALDIAQIADSLYYEDASVQILHDNQIYNLERVDGNLEGYIREEGAFAQAPNYLYKIRTANIPLIDDEAYTLQINTTDNTEPVSSTIDLVGASNITTPSSSIGFDYIQPTRVRWRKGDNARIFDILIQVNYRERRLSSSTGFERKFVTWNMGSNIESSNDDIENFERPGIDFYAFLAGELEANPDIERRFDDITVILHSGGFEILELNRVSGANLGITSSQDVPNYTNLSRGRGIFTSKFKEEKPGIALKSSSMDSLIEGQITKDLNFKS
ncbi:MAG: DUF4249 family protein [Saprospiraceae bacterium]|nr:DUF4249 family protein [Saprospiraceae bacterium]